MIRSASSASCWPRSRRAEVLGLVRGLDLVEPGLVWTPEWHPEPGGHVTERPSDCYYYALMARKP